MRAPRLNLVIGYLGERLHLRDEFLVEAFNVGRRGEGTELVRRNPVRLLRINS